LVKQKAPKGAFLLNIIMNIELIIRMYKHGYTAEEIGLRLRRQVEVIQLVIQNHEKHLKNKKPE
jgi:hypothetical protein